MSERTSQETAVVEAPPRIMTPKMMVLTAVIAAVLSAISITITAFTPQWMQWGNTFTPGNIGLIMFSIFLLLAEIVPSIKKIDMRRLTVLWAVFTITVAYAYGWVPMSTLDNMLTAKIWYPQFGEMFSMLWGPRLEVQQLQLQGGVAVPWGEYMPALAAWIVIAILWWLFMTSMVHIFRRQWLDVEALPYPASYVGLEMITDLAKAEERKSSRRLFLVAGIVGFLFFLPQALRNVFTWFPDIYGFSKDPWIPWALATVDTTRTPLKDTLVGLNGLELNPSSIAFAYLLPVDILLSGIISNVVFMIILPQIAYYFGYYQTVFTITWFNEKRDLIGQSPPFFFYAMGTYGMAAAVIIMWIVLNWRYIVQTFKWARSPDPKVDAQEPIPFRINYIIFFVAMVLLIATNIGIGGTSVLGAIMVIIVYFIQRGANSRSAGYGGPEIGDWPHAPGWINWAYPGLTEANVTPPIVNDYAMISRPQNIYCWNNNSQVLILYRIGKATNTNLRDLYIAMTIAMVVSIIVSFPLALQLRHMFGSSLQRPLTHEGWWTVFLFNPLSMQNYPSSDPGWYLAAVGGAVVIVAVYVARTLWYRFPLDPIGIWAGMAGTSTFILTSWTVAYVLKRITLRVGGVPLWEKKGVPIAVGFMVGWNLALFLSGVLGIYRFFFPY